MDHTYNIPLILLFLLLVGSNNALPFSQEDQFITGPLPNESDRFQWEDSASTDEHHCLFCVNKALSDSTYLYMQQQLCLQKYDENFTQLTQYEKVHTKYAFCSGEGHGEVPGCGVPETHDHSTWTCDPGYSNTNYSVYHSCYLTCDHNGEMMSQIYCNATLQWQVMMEGNMSTCVPEPVPVTTPTPVIPTEHKGDNKVLKYIGICVGALVGFVVLLVCVWCIMRVIKKKRSPSAQSSTDRMEMIDGITETETTANTPFILVPSHSSSTIAESNRSSVPDEEESLIKPEANYAQRTMTMNTDSSGPSCLKQPVADDSGIGASQSSNKTDQSNQTDQGTEAAGIDVLDNGDKNKSASGRSEQGCQATANGAANNDGSNRNPERSNVYTATGNRELSSNVDPLMGREVNILQKTEHKPINTSGAEANNISESENCNSATSTSENGATGTLNNTETREKSDKGSRRKSGNSSDRHQSVEKREDCNVAPGVKKSTDKPCVKVFTSRNSNMRSRSGSGNNITIQESIYSVPLATDFYMVARSQNGILIKEFKVERKSRDGPPYRGEDNEHMKFFHTIPSAIESDAGLFLWTIVLDNGDTFEDSFEIYISPVPECENTATNPLQRSASNEHWASSQGLVNAPGNSRNSIGQRQPPEGAEKDEKIRSGGIAPNIITQSAIVVQPLVNNIEMQPDNSQIGQSGDVGQMMQLNNLSDNSNRAPLNNLNGPRPNICLDPENNLNNVQNRNVSQSLGSQNIRSIESNSSVSNSHQPFHDADITEPVALSTDFNSIEVENISEQVRGESEPASAPHLDFSEILVNSGIQSRSNEPTCRNVFRPDSIQRLGHALSKILTLNPETIENDSTRSVSLPNDILDYTSVSHLDIDTFANDQSNCTNPIVSSNLRLVGSNPLEDIVTLNPNSFDYERPSAARSDPSGNSDETVHVESPRRSMGSENSLDERHNTPVKEVVPSAMDGQGARVEQQQQHHHHRQQQQPRAPGQESRSDTHASGKHRRELQECLYKCLTTLEDVTDREFRGKLENLADVGDKNGWYGLGQFYGYPTHYLEAVKLYYCHDINNGFMKHILDLLNKKGFKVGHLVYCFLTETYKNMPIVDLCIDRCPNHRQCNYCIDLRNRLHLNTPS